MKYRVFTYDDVWENPDGGWAINKIKPTDNYVNVGEDTTPRDICQYLENIGILGSSDMRRLAVSDLDSTIIEIHEKKKMFPLCRLEKSIF